MSIGFGVVRPLVVGLADLVVDVFGDVVDGVLDAALVVVCVALGCVLELVVVVRLGVGRAWVGAGDDGAGADEVAAGAVVAAGATLVGSAWAVVAAHVIATAAPSVRTTNRAPDTVDRRSCGLPSRVKIGEPDAILSRRP